MSYSLLIFTRTPRISKHKEQENKKKNSIRKIAYWPWYSDFSSYTTMTHDRH